MGSTESQVTNEVLEIEITTERIIKGSVPYCPMTSVFKSYYSTCKINCRDWCGTGFFISLPIYKNGHRICGLVTNNHVLPQDELLSGRTFTVIFDANNQRQIFRLTDDKYRFTSPLLDITFIEFAPDELPSEVGFLIPYEATTESNAYAFITQHPFGGCCSMAQGNVSQVFGFDLKHKISTQPGSSGSPLVNNDGYVIGVHKAGIMNENVNKATDIFYLISALKRLIGVGNASIGESISNAKSLSIAELNELKDHGLHQTSSPYLFISPRSFTVTALWFYRTNFGWFWTPTKPKSDHLAHLRECNWSFIHPYFHIKAIGGYYDQRAPASRNIELIEWLATTVLRFNI